MVRGRSRELPIDRRLNEASAEVKISRGVGQEANFPGSRVTPFGFQGSYADSTGLIYLINRYYDPTTDQFLSIDPDVATTNQPYVFTNDNPLNSEDPLGLAEVGEGESANEFEVPDGYSNSAEPEADADENSQEIDKLSKSGEEKDPSDKGGKLTRAGRALAKASEIFGKLKGSAANLNALGQEQLDEILTNPGTDQSTMRGGNFKGGTVFTSPEGISAVFSPSGVFQYFKWG